MVNSTFSIIAALGAASGVLAAWLVWRARQPVAPLPACCGQSAPAAAPGPGWRERAVRALDYLRTRREWRYRTPWVLVLGQQGAGKSSVLASWSHGRGAEGRERQLALPGCSWRFAGHGALLDVPGAWMPGAAGDAEAAGQAWHRVLAGLAGLRPERALDGVLLVVSAATLLAEDAPQRMARAADVARQLRIVQERCGFSMPLYVLVTHTDAVDGFGAFWRCQPETLRDGMFGWSAPRQFDDGVPAAWAGAAFDEVGVRLKALQTQAAARRDQLEGGQFDAAVLFPRHLQQLRAPFAHWLDAVLQPQAWNSGFFCRGIYFTGALGALDALPSEGARPDLKFIDALLADKVLSEPRLARPTRHAVFSRDRVLRAMQMGGIALLLALAATQIAASVRIARQAQSVKAALASLQPLAKAPPEHACPARDPVFQAIAQVAAIDTDARHWSMPLSLADRRMTTSSARQVADGVFRQVVLPGLSCQLARRADLAGQARQRAAPPGFPGAQAALFKEIDELTVLEQNLALLHRLDGSAPNAAGRLALADFIALTEYAYDAPLPGAVRRSPGLLPAVLALVQGQSRFELTPAFRLGAAAHIAQRAVALRALLGGEVERGQDLLARLERRQEPLLSHSRQFADWLAWISAAWDGTAASPLAQTHAQLAPRLARLRSLGAYPAPALRHLEQALASFAPASLPAVEDISRRQLGAFGPLFERGDTGLVLNPRLASELAGLRALLARDFMQIQHADGFACKADASAWSPGQLELARTYAADYDSFAAARSLPPLDGSAAAVRGVRPLYDQLARHQLESVLNNNLLWAQVTPPARLGPDAYSAPGDLRQERASTEFARVLQPIVSLQQVYADKGMPGLHAVSQCVRSFASRSLGRIERLAEQDQLYQPQQAGANGRLFDLGSAPQVKDYLDQQAERAAVLVRYARPYVSYLLNAGGADSARLAPGERPAYWANTIDEFSRHQQKDPKGQVALLADVIARQLPALAAPGCSAALAAPRPEAGNDLFSARRLQLENQAQLRCKGARHAQALDAYAPLARRFNLELAGRYPFAAPDSDEITPAAVRRFFAEYGAVRAELLLKMEGLPGPYWERARAFLARLDSVSRFFDGNLLPAEPGEAPAVPEAAATPGAPVPRGDAIRLTVAFRPAAPHSAVSNQIVRWTLRSGTAVSGLPNRASSVDWTYGQPLSVALEWASHSLLRPQADREQPGLRVNEAVATFSAGGQWALLRLMDRHAAQAGPGARRRLLELTVPVAAAAPLPGVAPVPASVFLTLDLAGRRGAPLTLPPAFPQRAPD